MIDDISFVAFTVDKDLRLFCTHVCVLSTFSNDVELGRCCTRCSWLPMTYFTVMSFDYCGKTLAFTPVMILACVVLQSSAVYRAMALVVSIKWRNLFKFCKKRRFYFMYLMYFFNSMSVMFAAELVQQIARAAPAATALPLQRLQRAVVRFFFFLSQNENLQIIPTALLSVLLCHVQLILEPPIFTAVT